MRPPFWVADALQIRLAQCVRHSEWRTPLKFAKFDASANLGGGRAADSLGLMRPPLRLTDAPQVSFVWYASFSLGLMRPSLRVTDAPQARAPQVRSQWWPLRLTDAHQVRSVWYASISFGFMRPSLEWRASLKLACLKFARSGASATPSDGQAASSHGSDASAITIGGRASS